MQSFWADKFLKRSIEMLIWAFEFLEWYTGGRGRKWVCTVMLIRWKSRNKLEYRKIEKKIKLWRRFSHNIKVSASFLASLLITCCKYKLQTQTQTQTQIQIQIREYRCFFGLSAHYWWANSVQSPIVSFTQYCLLGRFQQSIERKTKCKSLRLKEEMVFLAFGLVSKW